MIENGTGGGNTVSGLSFEHEADLLSLLKNTEGYTVEDNIIYYHSKEVARSYRKNNLYIYFNSIGHDYKKYISKRLLPDEAVYVIKNNILFIVEIKFQQVAGSVDEKLQTCDFKKKQYKKLLAPLNIDVDYIYVLSDWFRRPEYKDTLDYIISVGCQFYFQYLPLEKLGLPVPPNKKIVSI